MIWIDVRPVRFYLVNVFILFSLHDYTAKRKYTCVNLTYVYTLSGLKRPLLPQIGFGLFGP